MTKNPSIFEKRNYLKPFEYPEIMEYVDAINHTYWIHTKWNYEADVNDFKLLPLKDQSVIKNCLLAISQIEVSVKTFWGNLYNWLPKPEMNALGATFAECEVRHERSYSHLLEILHLNHDYENLMLIPEIKGRVDYMEKYMKKNDNPQQYAVTLALFSLFIENVSLFSQFAIMKSYNKHLNIMKDIDNVIQFTQQEEQIHALAGAYLVKLIRTENPEWFDDEFIATIQKAAMKSYEAELKILKWIVGDGQVPNTSMESLEEFLKFRFNNSFKLLDLPYLFEIDYDRLSDLQWFADELLTNTNYDFFYKKSTNYSKNVKSITVNDIF